MMTNLCKEDPQVGLSIVDSCQQAATTGYSLSERGNIFKSENRLTKIRDMYQY